MGRPQLVITLPKRADLFMVGAALLGAAAFPPVGLWPLSVLSTLLFVRILRDRNPSEARNLGVEYGLVYALGTMYWFFGIFGFLSICLLALMAGYFGLLANLIVLTRGRAPWLRALLVAVAAVAVEWLRGDAWYLRFPWYTMPHALAQEPACVAAVRWLGTYGLSFLLWFMLAWSVFGRIWYLVSIVLLPLFAGLLAPVDPPNRMAAVVQTEKDGNAAFLLASAKLDKVDLVVMPELAYTRPYTDVLLYPRGPVALAKSLGCPLVFGAIEGEYGQPKFQNIAAVLDANGELLGVFPKQHPVPLMADGKPGQERPVFPTAQGTLGVAICYDLDAPAIAASLVASGATVLVLPTYDAMSWSRPQHLHHELLVRLRAVETNRWVVRAASSGRSEAIDPQGQPSAKGVEIGESGVATVAYGHLTGVTMGSRLHLLGPGCGILTLLFLGGLGYRSWAQRKTHK